MVLRIYVRHCTTARKLPRTRIVCNQWTSTKCQPYVRHTHFRPITSREIQFRYITYSLFAKQSRKKLRRQTYMWCRAVTILQLIEVQSAVSLVWRSPLQTNIRCVVPRDGDFTRGTWRYNSYASSNVLLCGAQSRREGVAARGKRLCSRPRQSDQFCNQGIFTISDIGDVNQLLGSFPIPSLLSRAPAEIEVGAFSLKFWHPVATNLKIFLRIKWPNFTQNFPILCRILKHLNSAKH